MEINSDFTQRVVVHGSQLPWRASPMAFVERRMLDRIGDEVARATSIVRYAPNSKFSAHVHGGGEEFLVLEGVFQDEHGDYPVGSYVRNPPQSSHTPGSKSGCVIFVKLRQFATSDRTKVNLNIQDLPTVIDSERPGVAIATLYKNEIEEVRVEKWEANAEVAINAPGGAELLVLSGSFKSEGDELTTQSWLRVPADSVIIAHAGAEGAKVWLKMGHLLSLSTS
ncbi:MAG: cupin domain-containing protein [Cyanobacteria bacterium J06621_12]